MEYQLRQRELLQPAYTQHDAPKADPRVSGDPLPSSQSVWEYWQRQQHIAVDFFSEQSQSYEQEQHLCPQLPPQLQQQRQQDQQRCLQPLQTQYLLGECAEDLSTMGARWMEGLPDRAYWAGQAQPATAVLVDQTPYHGQQAAYQQQQQQPERQPPEQPPEQPPREPAAQRPQQQCQVPRQHLDWRALLPAPPSPRALQKELLAYGCLLPVEGPGLAGGGRAYRGAWPGSDDVYSD